MEKRKTKISSNTFTINFRKNSFYTENEKYRTLMKLVRYKQFKKMLSKCNI